MTSQTLSKVSYVVLRCRLFSTLRQHIAQKVVSTNTPSFWIRNELYDVGVGKY